MVDVGSSDGHLAKALRDKGCQVIGVDLVEPENADDFDEFIKWDLDDALPPVGRTVLTSTGNVAFAVQRLMLVLGQFNYGPRGILDMTHTRLFTARTIRRLFCRPVSRSVSPSGSLLHFRWRSAYRPIGRRLLTANRAAIRISATLFSYQIFLVLEPPSDLARVIARSARHPESANGPACLAASDSSIHRLLGLKRLAYPRERRPELGQ